MKGHPVVASICRSVNENARFEQPSPVLSQYDQRMRVLELTVQLLIARLIMEDFWADGFKEAGDLVAAVPMPTFVYAKANRHLHNAHEYCQQQEYGAATFELRALRGQLHRL
jgi:hypothetical protein